MQRFAVGPFSSSMLGNDSTKERREKGLKKSFIAIAFVILGFGLLISPASYATAPAAGDIPDFRLIAPNGAAGVLDLDDYAIDYDDYSFNADTDLSWTVSSNLLAPAGTKDASNVLSLASGGAAGDAGTYDFQVSDATGSDTDSSNVHVVTAIGTFPALSQDFLISPSASTTGFTHLLDIVGATGANVLNINGQAQGTGAMTWTDVSIANVYDASLNAAYSPRSIAASGVGAATVSGLTASINSAGAFVLTSLGSGLSDPVLVGFKGQSTGASDWDGVSVFVSNALLARRQSYQEVSPSYGVDDGMETTAVGRIRSRLVGPGLNTLIPGTADCVWVLDGQQSAIASGSAGGYPSATVIANADLPASLQASGVSFAGDHSGQALKVSLNASGTAGSGGFIAMNSPVAASAGYAYAVEMSVATNATDAQRTPSIVLALHTFGYREISVSELGPANSATPGQNVTEISSAPLQSDGWVRMRAYLEPSANGLADAAANQQGLGVTLIPANLSTAGGVDLYVDNVKIYKSALPDDLAFGNAKIAFAGRPDISVGTRVRAYVDPSLSFGGFEGDLVYGNFERGTGAISTGTGFTGGNINGWFAGNVYATGVSASVGASIAATKLEAGDANWLSITFAATNNAASSGLPAVVRTRRMAPVSSGTTEFAPGLYVISADIHTNSGATNPPAAYLVTSDKTFLTYGYLITSGGTNGAVRRLRSAVAMRNNNFLIIQLAASQASDNLAGELHVDNVQVEQIADSSVYTDFSLFQ